MARVKIEHHGLTWLAAAAATLAAVSAAGAQFKGKPFPDFTRTELLAYE